jgi:AraC-like DNA-binding protein
MIISSQDFEYQGRVLITRATIKAPYRMEGVFEDEGCFLYFQDAGFKMQSQEIKDKAINGKEAVLLRCGTYFFDLLDTVNSDTVDIFAVHLFPEVLKNIYADQVPQIIEKCKVSKQSKVVAAEDVIAKFIESLGFYFEHPELVTEDILELKIKELILLLIQTKNVDSILELISDLYAPRTVQLKKVIDTHIYSNFSMDELAKLSNLSLSSFKREFKKTYNHSPQSYINAKKLEKAQALLQSTELSISDIAYDIGFNDPQYFTRLFSKNIGITPSDFRNQNTL